MDSSDNCSSDEYGDLQTNIRFLKLIEKHECLWQHTSPDFTKNHVKVQAWKNIAKAVNGTEERCSRRWRYIRTTYAKYVKSNFKTGEQKSKYYLSPHVDFVKPYVKLPPCFLSNESISDQNKEDSQDVLGCTKTSTTQNKIVTDFQNQNETELNLEQQFLDLIEGTGEQDTNTKTDELKDVQSPKVASSSSNLICNMEVPDKEAEQNLKIIPLKSFVNENSMFLESILPFVDDMSKTQIRRFRRKVMSLVNDILQNKDIDSPELQKMDS